VAIIAIYPEDSSIYIKSLLNLLDGLDRANITPVIVSNGIIPTLLLEKLEYYDAVIVLRKNYGRDFGAYKSGILWLHTNYGLNFKSLYLINDTLFWHSDCYKILQALKNITWGGLFLNLAKEAHVNSFFMKFDMVILQDYRFVNFWKKYLPSQFKRHAIHKGEIKLSTTLIKAGYMPDVLANPQYLFSKINILSKSSTKILYSIPPCDIYPSGNHYFPIVKKDSKKPDLGTEGKDLIKHCGVYINRDTPHSLGLHFAILANFPIKRDLYKYYSLGEIHYVLNIISRNFADEVVMDFERVMTMRMLVDRKNEILKLLGEA
jgi:hypothetical protein